MTSVPIARLLQRVEPLRSQLLAHPIYSRLRTLEDVRCFLSHHVFAVWDFMSLLKALQRRLTSVDPVWRPRGDAVVRRLVNEIVLGEESDEDGEGYSSHYELYRRAMREAGADARAMDAVLAHLERGDAPAEALRLAPEPARRFCTTTFDLVERGSLPAIAAAFTLGREDVIPSMFTQLVADLHARHEGGLPTLVDYLDRHVHLDAERHGPMSMRMLECVCGDDEGAFEAAVAGAEAALRARIALWDGIAGVLGKREATATSAT